MRHSRDADALYRDAARLLGTATRAALIAAPPHSGIKVQGEFEVHQWTEAHLYRAFSGGVPCVLKFPARSALAEHELRVYESVVDERRRHLVQVELVSFLNLPHGHASPSLALKLPPYASALSACRRGPDLVDVFNTAAKAALLGLEALHSAGLCHLDVKPGNLFIDVEGACFLGDYGAALLQGAGVQRTTEAFLPREFAVLQAQQLLTARPAVDFGMLACTLVHLMDAAAPASPSLVGHSVPRARHQRDCSSPPRCHGVRAAGQPGHHADREGSETVRRAAVGDGGGIESMRRKLWLWSVGRTGAAVASCSVSGRERTMNGWLNRNRWRS